MSLSEEYEQTVKARDAYIEKMEAQIDDWNTEIDRVMDDAREVNPDAEPDRKIHYERQLSKMRIPREEMREHVREVRESGIDEFEGLRGRIDDAWAQMSRNFDEAVKAVDSDKAA